MTSLTKQRKNLIYLITYLAYTSIYIARINLSMAGPEMKALQVLTTSQLGLLGTAFSVFYAVGRLLNSLRSDTEEPKKMIGIGLLFTGLANIGIGFLPPFAGTLLLWCANAFAQSMLWSSVLRIVCALYEEGPVRATRLSFMVSTVAAGQIAGILVASAVLSHLGLCWAFYLPGLITLALSAAVFLLYPQLEKTSAPGPKAPVISKTAQVSPNPPASDFLKADSSAFKKNGSCLHQTVKVMFLQKLLPKVRGILGYDSVRLMLLPDLFMGLMKDNVTFWMAVYFVDEYGIDLSGVAGYVLLIPLVGLAGRLLFPLALKLCGGNEHKVSLISFAGCFLASLLLLLVRNALLAVICLSLVYAFMSLANSSMISIFPSRFASRGCMGSISGLMDFAAYLGAGIGSLLFGFTIEKAGYSSMFAVWAVLSAAGCLILKKMTKTQTRNHCPAK